MKSGWSIGFQIHYFDNLSCLSLNGKDGWQNLMRHKKIVHIGKT